MYWAVLLSIRRAFLAALWPTWRTAPIWRPSWSKMAYSLLTSTSLAFWLTTSTGSVNRVPPPAGAAGATPVRATSRTMRSVARVVVGTGLAPTGASTDWRPWDETCSLQRPPSHHRLSWRPKGSGYQPGGCACGDGCDMAAEPSAVAGANDRGPAGFSAAHHVAHPLVRIRGREVGAGVGPPALGPGPGRAHQGGGHRGQVAQLGGRGAVTGGGHRGRVGRGPAGGRQRRVRPQHAGVGGHRPLEGGPRRGD